MLSFNLSSWLFKLGKIKSIIGTIINTHTNGAIDQAGEINIPRKLDDIIAKETLKNVLDNIYTELNKDSFISNRLQSAFFQKGSLS